jgi:hypothetical protein
MDLGDNFPRGINFWAFTKEEKVMNTIYSFKTLHGIEPKSPAGVSYDPYPAASSKNKTFYKWSNDNEVYTELSATGFEEVSDGYIVFFIGEAPALDNSKTGASLNAPRNICFTKISKD